MRKRASKSPSEPQKAAQSAVYWAVRTGKLNRAPCEVCGDAKADAHHDDYSKPLDVRWLCRVHHAARHAELGWGKAGSAGRGRRGINWDEQPLGQISDRAMAERCGVALSTAQVARKRRGIARYSL